MSQYPTSEKLFEIIQNEEFLAFFSLQQPAGVGAELTGLAKIARPAAEKQGAPVNYLSITFLIDTPSEALFIAAKQLFAKLAVAGFQRNVPDVRALTSLPATMFPGPHYVHQLDLIFSKPLPKDVSVMISQTAGAVRQLLGVQTEAPQFWSDPAQAPAKSAAEKANLGARLKALFEALSR